MKRFIKRQASAFAHHRTERVFRSRNRTMAPGMDLEHQLRTHLSDVEKMNAKERLIWASKTHPGHVAMSTSFGIHSAVLLHMATQVDPDLPVVWIDTGYLMPETVIFYILPLVQIVFNFAILTNHYNTSVSIRRDLARGVGPESFRLDICNFTSANGGNIWKNLGR